MYVDMDYRAENFVSIHIYIYAHMYLIGIQVRLYGYPKNTCQSGAFLALCTPEDRITSSLSTS